MGTQDPGLGWRVGPSSLGELNGVMQYVAQEHHADQLNSLAFEFDELPESKAAGIRLSFNEAIRSKRRQEILRAAWDHFRKYGTPWAALAAALYLSTHREEIGTAVDIGITMADGTNRAPTAAEWQTIHRLAARRGIAHTGANFNPREEWHHNAGYAESVPPYPNVRIAMSPITACPAPTPSKPKRTRTTQIGWL